MGKRWIKEAWDKGELKITENMNCPFHNPEHKANVETELDACKKHKWASKAWFKPWYEKTFKRSKA